MTATPAIEIRPGLRARPRVAAVMFDFDGTISLIRAGWVEVMLDGMRALCPAKPGEDAAALADALRHDIVRLAGRPTIDQMIVFAERLRARGGAEADPAALKTDFLRRLGERCAERHAAITLGARDAHLMPGTDAALAAFAARGAELWLASGTDHDDVLREAALLGVDRPFAGRIHGALRPPAVMTKAMVVARMLAQGLPGERIVAIGDGPVEMREIKAVGGLAIGIASDEDCPGSGRVDPAKRELLIAAGADAIIADFRDLPALMAVITGDA